MNFLETLEAIRALIYEFPQYRKIFIEKAANGAAVINALENEIAGIIGVPPSGSKVARYHAISGQLARGEVALPHPNVYGRTNEFVSECAHAGIGGRFDDTADMMALALPQMTASSGGGAVFVIDRHNRYQRYRDYIDGIERRDVDPAFAKAIIDGRGLDDVTDQQLDSYLFGPYMAD
jgi:predicted phage terminase large subunit-like protein